MKRLLILSLFAMFLAACSSNNPPYPGGPGAVMNCNDARVIVKANGREIGRAFADRNAEAIGRLELQNRDIIHNNMRCFPKLEKNIKKYKKMHEEEMM